MAEEKDEKVGQKEKPKKSKKWFFCCGIIVLLIVAYIGYSIYDSRKGSTTKKSTPAPARNYEFHEPSAEAANRKIDCLSFIAFRITKKNVLCLNLYQTSTQDITNKLSSGSYERVIVYGEKVAFDAPTNNPANLANFPEAFYNTAKFTDQVTMPKLMDFYGVANLDYINTEFAPYPSIYFQFESSEKTKDDCRNELIDGCATGHYHIELDEARLKPTFFPILSYYRAGSTDSIEMTYSLPENCDSGSTMLHEIGHQLTKAQNVHITGMEMTLNEPPEWFGEHQAGLTEILGPELVCGQGTISGYKSSINNKEGKTNIIEFNSIFPPAPLSHDEPKEDQTCELAIINSMYHWLQKGDYIRQHQSFFQAFNNRMAQGRIKDDKEFMDFILGLFGSDTSEKDFLSSKGCGV